MRSVYNLNVICISSGNDSLLEPNEIQIITNDGKSLSLSNVKKLIHSDMLWSEEPMDEPTNPLESSSTICKSLLENMENMINEKDHENPKIKYLLKAIDALQDSLTYTVEENQNLKKKNSILETKIQFIEKEKSKLKNQISNHPTVTKDKSFASIAKNSVSLEQKIKGISLSKEEMEVKMAEKEKDLKNFFKPRFFKNKSVTNQVIKPFEKDQDLQVIYLEGVPQKRIKEIKKFFFENFFKMSNILHIQFISGQICEFIINMEYYDSFIKKCRSFGFKECLNYDPSKPNFIKDAATTQSNFELKAKIEKGFYNRISKELVTYSERIQSEELNTIQKNKSLKLRAFFEGWLVYKFGP